MSRVTACTNVNLQELSGRIKFCVGEVSKLRLGSSCGFVDCVSRLSGEHCASWHPQYVRLQSK